MKKILIICNYNAPYAGNFISSLLFLLKKLSEEFKVMVAFPKQAKTRYWVDSFESDIFYYDCTSKAKKINSLVKIIKDNNISYVYSHFESPLLIGLISRFSRIKKIFCHIHSDFSCGKESFASKFKNFISFKLNIFKIKYFFVFRPKKSYKNSIYIANALCKKRVEQKGEQYHLKCNSKTINILMMGWDPIIKGVDVAIKAINNLDKYHLYIVSGEKNETDIISNFSKYRNFSVIPPTSNVFNYMSKIDCFLSASRSEGFSYSILEALYENKVVLMSNIDGTKWAEKYDGVYQFDNGSCESLAKVLKSIDFRKTYNRIEIGDKYDIDKWVNTIYNELME